jgi:basic membrane protein A
MKNPLKHTVLCAISSLFMASAAAETTVGFVYVGPTNDFGYNYAMHQGRQYLDDTLENVSTVFFENIPENAEVQRVMQRMIRRNVDIVFATSYGYLDHALAVAARNPNTTFVHAGGLQKAENLSTFFADIDEALYLAGMTAGLMTETNKLGFIAAHPIPQVLRNINAFTRGARRVNPEITTSLIWTASWSNPSEEAAAANTLIDNGVDVLVGHIDSPINYTQVAEQRGVFAVGYHADASQFAPEGWLVGAQWNWGPMMVEIVQSIKDGTWESEHLRGNFTTGATKLTDFGPAVPEDVRKQVLEVKEKIMAGDYFIWQGPVIGQNGDELFAEDMTMEQVETMSFLVEGVQGRLP